jgi:serine protein kinase
MAKFDILKAADEYRAQADKLKWDGTFADYLEIVRENPRVADLAHARVFNMVMSPGTEERPDGSRAYQFFENEIFGLEKVQAHLVEEYFSPASRRLDIRKRILMLVGPVGGGKSTISTLIKKGMEKFSRDDDGAVYAIKGCPMHEEPLHLVPEGTARGFQERVRRSHRGRSMPRLPIPSGARLEERPRQRPGGAHRLFRARSVRHRNVQAC